MTLRIFYFGLPLGALLLEADGNAFDGIALAPVEAPGKRRLLRRHPTRVLLASRLGTDFEAAVDRALAQSSPDLIVSWFWTRLLPTRWLQQARLGAIGSHPSLLPRHRGTDPYFWTIDSGDWEAGVSVHLLDGDYDTGAVLDQERLLVDERNAWQLARALDRPSLRALRRVVGRFARGDTVFALPQDEALATRAPEPRGEFLRADFHWPTERVLRRVRALSPVPGLALALGGERFFVTAAKPAADFTLALEPGEGQIRAGRLLLRTGDGAISVERAAVVNAEEDLDLVDGAVLASRIAARLAGST